MKTIFFAGKIKTVSPVAVTVPDTVGMPKDSAGNAYLPANSIRGKLRHSLHEAIARHYADQGKPLTVDQHYMLGSGVDTARALKDTSSNIGANTARRAANPVLSVFGNWGLAGKLGVGSGYTGTKAVIHGAGVRKHVGKEWLDQIIDLSEIDYLTEILSQDGQTSQDSQPIKDRQKLLKRELKGADATRKTEINTELADLDQQLRELKDLRTGASESIQRPLEGFEVIDHGTTMPHRMILKNPTDTELHTVLLSIAAWAYEPMIGGHHNLGCGNIDAEWEIYEQAFLSNARTKIGTVGFNETGFFVEGIVFDAAATLQHITTDFDLAQV
jgi:hypothetical protein